MPFRTFAMSGIYCHTNARELVRKGDFCGEEGIGSDLDELGAGVVNDDAPRGVPGAKVPHRNVQPGSRRKILTTQMTISSRIVQPTK
jgi:hypothetical protein